MSLFQGFLTYFTVWWITLFMVLPWSVGREENPESGWDPGAPKNPRIGLKMLINTMLAAVVWGGIYLFIEYYL